MFSSLASTQFCEMSSTRSSNSGCLSSLWCECRDRSGDGVVCAYVRLERRQQDKTHLEGRMGILRVISLLHFPPCLATQFPQQNLGQLVFGTSGITSFAAWSSNSVEQCFYLPLPFYYAETIISYTFFSNLTTT